MALAGSRAQVNPTVERGPPSMYACYCNSREIFLFCANHLTKEMMSDSWSMCVHDPEMMLFGEHVSCGEGIPGEDILEIEYAPDLLRQYKIYRSQYILTTIFS